MADDKQVSAFIAKWKDAAGSERSNYQLFLTELCDVLDAPKPDPAGADTTRNAYVFERPVPLQQPDGSETTGFIDLYKRGCFVLETKQYAAQVQQTDLQLAVAPAPKKGGPVRGTKGWDDAMLKARGQAERYARNLPADEEPPPFVVVVDVGHSFELYADFTQKGKAYRPFPDPSSCRFKIADLADPKILGRLRAVWTAPLTLDPSKHAAEVTREVAAHLAELSKSFEKEGHEPQVVADFLARCLFCMFAEDVGLLPEHSFSRLLDECQGNPGGFVPMLTTLFKEMDKGAEFSLVLRRKLLRFNGGLFDDSTVLKVDGTQLGLLRAAAKLDWRNVEPSIFGTLLERALNPQERHKLGAHYTPRAYVERLVLPTVIDPLREDWNAARAAAVLLAKAGDEKSAVAEVRAFHRKLCETRVLDAACGSGNFLYVTLEMMKQLEGEVLTLLDDLGDTQALLDLQSLTVDPHQFLGIEINPRAAAITDLVLWIGYLQWHFKTRGRTSPPEPIIRKFHNVECRDAVLAYDAEEPVTWFDAAENPDLPGLPESVRAEVKKRKDEILAAPDKWRRKLVEVWDRRSTKVDPVTGRDVPDESKRTYLRRYINPRPAAWPAADFIVGNPPFLGKGRMREDLGDGYAETLRETYPDVPSSADFVMYWWHRSAGLAAADKVRRFGLITTNSIRQTFNRRVVQHALDHGVYLTFAIPDHPWVDTAEGAAVRIAMTVGAPVPKEVATKNAKTTKEKPKAVLAQVKSEESTPNGESHVQLGLKLGLIAADLSNSPSIAAAQQLRANEGLSCPGVKLHGSGFIVTPEQAAAFGKGAEDVVHSYRNGRDLTDKPRNVLVIDLFGLSEKDVRTKYPSVYQHVLTNVKPERDQNPRPTYRDNWWTFGEPRRDLRPALIGLSRYIATVETAKHRIFQFLDASVRPDNKLIVIATEDACHLGVLSSRIHASWALAQGALLEDRPVYPKTECFDPFPFPDCDAAAKQRIRELAEELDAHRKRAQERHGIGLTDMYNVLEKVRAGEALTAKEQAVHDRALVSTLRQLHDDLDRAVAEAYGWPWPLTDAEILERVVALNRERAAEEARGVIRWLRPEYQNPSNAKKTQDHLDLGAGADAKPVRKSKIETRKSKQPWPKTLPEQVRAVEALIAAHGRLTAADLAKHFQRAKPATIAEILDTLTTLGRL